ncbi:MULTISPECIES: PadR family transcriptional regulator [unclassified Streptomyces]|uniref:PadR family transcriptional regulator n=1 Tax=unclassified Streptomyces TaxID=2593676 RepID=UPI00225B5DCC|nr:MULTISPECIES: PadR family transcriptional regulator [unclassified Streptomyces]MCX5046933.1 PadR family transcriptional regulator [Streptomyces sp. NBC_00474]MCX5058367.1 PadR family transcriptional regulator [Streptomyces sp. NBC_00452]MCX5244753.1 PadR family transcriptional regulator [Streptomyces sp. NBC_00201]
MVMKRRKLSNPLALAVLVTLWQKPMHPYEIAQTLRRQGKDTSTKINYGSLYTVVQSLEKHGFVEVTDVERQGNRPERTVYGLTEAGREEMTEWLSDLVAVPAKEYPIFETALSLVGALPPDEVVRLLEERLNSLEVQAASARGALAKLYETLPRLFLIETEYQLHMIEAQAEWVRGFLEEIRKGSLPGVEGWRRFHETGELPPEFR